MGSGSSRRRGAAAPAVAENRELLAAAEDEEVAALPGPGHRAPVPVGPLLPRDSGLCGLAAAAGSGAGAPPERPALSAGSPPGPEESTTDRHRCPKPAGQSTISYDYSEEELMASIEREYCR